MNSIPTHLRPPLKDSVNVRQMAPRGRKGNGPALAQCAWRVVGAVFGFISACCAASPQTSMAQTVLHASGTTNTLISWRNVTAKSTYGMASEWLSRYPPDQQEWIQSPRCAIAVIKYEYATIGGLGEPTNATAALFMPSGVDFACQGPRPLVLYAHGTAIDRREDMAAVDTPHNPALQSARNVALIFAAQGDLVIAPNYAGYDRSTLPYAPYLNGAQQAQDMLDALTAGRQLLALLKGPSWPNGQLFVTGYSQGGYVAMATLRALDRQNHPATAGATLSGPYALAAEADELFLGHASLGATVYLSMVANSYAHMVHGHIHLTNLFNPRFSESPALFPELLPQAGFAALVENQKIPLTALFQSPPTGFENPNILTQNLTNSIEFDPVNYLVRTSFRASYLADLRRHPDGAAPADGSSPDFTRQVPHLAEGPLNPMRQDLKKNDLRNYTPRMPLLMCGARKDPEVFWTQGTATMQAMLGQADPTKYPVRFGTLDLDSVDRPSSWSSTGLDAQQNERLRVLGYRLRDDFIAHEYHNPLNSLMLVLDKEGYHRAVAPYCTIAAREFFHQF